MWENFRDALTEKTRQPTTNDHKASRVRQSLAGVIFDSAPVAELYSFPQALAQCSWRDRADVLRTFGDRYLNMNRDAEIRKIAQKAQEQYVLRLQDDPLRVPQLYLYSENDPIAPPAFIDQLAAHRQSLGVSVTQKKWKDSQHCGHLKVHPDEYEQTLRDFLGTDAASSHLRSKL